MDDRRERHRSRLISTIPGVGAVDRAGRAGPKVFISYAREDAEYVDRLDAHLRERGIDVWFDAALRRGERYPARLEEMIAESAAVAVVLTPSSKASEWVVDEIVFARSKGIQLFPLLVLGEPWMMLSGRDTEDVRALRMPGRRYTDDLRSLVLGADRPTPGLGVSSRSESRARSPALGLASGMAQLEAALGRRDWYQADLLTYRILLDLGTPTGRFEPRPKWLSRSSIDAIPCADLRTIDRLWVTHTGGAFGIEPKARLLPDGNIEQVVFERRLAFFESLGWHDGRNFRRHHSDLRFDAEAPDGHLPSFRSHLLDDEVHWHSLWTMAALRIVVRFINCQNDQKETRPT